MLVKKLGMRHIVMGYDHAFGKNREGNIDSLIALGQRNNFQVTSIPPLVHGGHPVSSTWCRAALDEGDVSLLRLLLGRPYRLEGRVEQGYHRGHEIGFPTANLRPDAPEQMLPASGVYAVQAQLDDGRRFDGVCNIGVNPTFHNERLSVEAHLLDFDGDLYNTHLALEFFARLRGEISFASVSELALQSTRDIELARGIGRGTREP